MARSSRSASPTTRPFLSYFSGNTIQICPVGALTSAEYRFRSRPFDLVSTPGVAEHDACGAAIRVDHRRGKVMRRLAGNDPEVNEEWISDKDRFAFHYARQDDRLTHPMVREDGELRPASWPEAFAVAARGLHAAGSAAVLPGGRLTAEDAYAYAKFARVSLGTNDIDFRARPHTAEEADFLASRVALSMDVTYDDLERASVVVLAGLEPEDEAATIFLRLRKASKGSTKVVALAPFATRGLGKMKGRLIPTAPGGEAEALRALAEDGTTALDSGGVILVGERLAQHHGALTAAARAGPHDRVRVSPGCRVVPGTAVRSRPAACRPCCPAVVPPVTPRPVSTPPPPGASPHLPEAAGRDADAILAALTDGSLGGVVVGGVDPDDTADPAATLAALDAASFVVSLELRETEVTRRADVVLPVAPVTDKAGTFVTWEGRPRPFEAVFTNPGSLPDLRVLSGIADELASLGQGSPLGFRTVPEVRSEMEAVGPWDGARPDPVLGEAPRRSHAEAGALALSTWKQLLDAGIDAGRRRQPGPTAVRPSHGSAPAPSPRSAARPATRWSSPVTAAPSRCRSRSSRTWSTDVVWLPTHSLGRGRPRRPRLARQHGHAEGSRPVIIPQDAHPRAPRRRRATGSRPSGRTRGGSSSSRPC